METSTYILLSYKHLEIDHDLNEIKILIKNAENIEFEINLRLYELIEDTSFLETAYNQVQKKTDALEGKLKENFISHPIPSQIIEEYNKIFG